jgi:hypothetical protein
MGHAQVPRRHCCPAAHCRPQAPQLFTSPPRFAQVPLQLVCPMAHWLKQRPKVQTCPAAQATPHAPQFVVLVATFTQTPPQSTCVVPPPGTPPPPAGQRQRPCWHVVPPVQVTPHAPQLLASLAVLTHDEPQRAVPGGHESWQPPLAHT